MTSYIDIYNKYFNQEHNATFNQSIYDAFNEATRIDSINGIDEFFICMLNNRKCSLDEIKLMIELDADPTYKSDRPFIEACMICDEDVVSFFINDLSICLEQVHITSYKLMNLARYKPDTLKLLIKNGLLLDDNLIELSMTHIDLFEYLIENNDNIDHVLKVFCKASYIKDSRIVVLLLNKIRQNSVSAKFINETLARFLIFMELTPSDVNMMITLGADPRYNNDIFLVLACGWPSNDVPKLLVTEYGCNVNSHDSDALIHAIDHKSTANIKFLAENNVRITEKIILIACARGDEACLKILLDYYDPEYFGKILIAHLLGKNKYNSSIKLLAQLGVNINQLASNYLENYYNNDK